MQNTPFPAIIPPCLIKNGAKSLNNLNPAVLSKLRFGSQQLSILKVLGEYQGKQALYFKQTPEILETLRQTSIVESAESSNRIEGITAPHHRIEKIVLKTTKPRNRSEQEIAGYRDALALIHESHEHMHLSTNLILQLHAMLYRYHAGTGGHWKLTDNKIVENYPDGHLKRVRFVPTPAVTTPQAMEDLVTTYQETKNQKLYEPLLVIPLAILDFLCIHPFSDGNGRAARLFTLLLLYQSGYQVGRYISLERVFEESKETYYETLEVSSKGWHENEADVFPWLNYFWGTLLRAYKELEDRVGKIKKGRGHKTEQIKYAISQKVAAFTISDLERDCPGVSREMLRKVLRKLRDQGKLSSIGTGRGAKWKKL